jgi:hypothetical protein
LSLRFRVFGLRVYGLGFMVKGHRLHCAVFRLSCTGLQALGLPDLADFEPRALAMAVPVENCRVQGSGFQVYNLGLRVQGLRFRIQVLGFRLQG